MRTLRTARRIRAWLAPAAAALLALCLPAPSSLAADLAGADGASYALRISSLKEVRFRSTVRQQFDYSCGSAAVATLLTYHFDHPVSEQAAFQQMYLHGDQQRIQRDGFSLLDIKRYLASLGYAADGFELPLEKLAEAGLPAIVLVAERGYHHFVVVKGVAGGRVLLGDPAGGTRALPRRQFDAIWQGGLLFVVHGSPGTPRFNAAADWRAAPQAVLAGGIERDSLLRQTLPKLGDGNF
ncbi:peptidase C39 [Massilia sp. Root351]|jgi:predicted double-glycine peptidase|uniref:C39 family peptidase n=1 Tax=Massilia sp. Root351 TaxID=1736522 RepID=UPI00070CCF13|nr:C39 family peptidase [Massilia sp. Root351]KQV80680.1 peptidase C39 [Massilia sp. Root351]